MYGRMSDEQSTVKWIEPIEHEPTVEMGRTPSRETTCGEAHAARRVAWTRGVRAAWTRGVAVQRGRAACVRARRAR
eukprot:2485780-Prymnesium_polylepis.1